MSENQARPSRWPAGSKFARPDDSVGFLLWQVLHLWQRYAKDGLADLDLTHMQFNVLAGIGWLSRDGSAPIQAAVAAHSQLDVMTVSQVVRKLEKKAFITRKTSETDARAKALHLTEAGTAALTAALPLIDRLDIDFFAATDVDVLMRELDALYRARAPEAGS